MGCEVLLLGGNHDSTWYMYNGLRDSVPIDHVIIEKGVRNRKKFLKRRARRVGYFNVFGQILFQAVCMPIIRKESRDRRSELIRELRLDNTRARDIPVREFPSVNYPDCREYIEKLQPRVIIVNGTGIIGKKVLASVQSVFINTHVGITPKYRGVHGGYWALALGEPENFGVTVHLVDAGIDTGNVLFQESGHVTDADNFNTYPIIQVALGIPLMERAVRDALKGTISITEPKTKESRLWYHPTIWFYLWKRWTRGVK